VQSRCAQETCGHEGNYRRECASDPSFSEHAQRRRSLRGGEPLATPQHVDPAKTTPDRRLRTHPIVPCLFPRRREHREPIE
jgi:hypothetical protein